jgi:hypothetical protein
VVAPAGAVRIELVWLDAVIQQPLARRQIRSEQSRWTDVVDRDRVTQRQQTLSILDVGDAGFLQWELRVST